MTTFRVVSGEHVGDDGKRYVAGQTVESEKALDKIFRNKFVPVDGVQRAPIPLNGSTQTGIRRTQASEEHVSFNGQVAQGNEVPTGGSPGPELDVFNAQAADPLLEQEKAEINALLEQQSARRLQLFAAKSGVAEARGEAVESLRPEGTRTVEEAAAARAEEEGVSASAKAQSATGEEQEEEVQTEDVSDQFPEAAEKGLTVGQAGKTYYLFSGEEQIGDFTKKTDVKKAIKEAPEPAAAE